MTYLRAVHWWALLAMLLAAGGIALAFTWPDRPIVALSVGLASITIAILSMSEGEESSE